MTLLLLIPGAGLLAWCLGYECGNHMQNWIVLRDQGRAIKERLL